MFLGGRVKKKLDNKFLLYCLDLKTGQDRLEGAGEARATVVRRDPPAGTRATSRASSRPSSTRTSWWCTAWYDVLAFDLKDGKLRWRYGCRSPSRSGTRSRAATCWSWRARRRRWPCTCRTEDPRGEVVWQEKEEGDLYMAALLLRATGWSAAQDAVQPHGAVPVHRQAHRPAGPAGPAPGGRAPADRQGPAGAAGGARRQAAGRHRRAGTTSCWTWRRCAVVWKRLIDANDPTRLPPMRLALNGDYLGGGQAGLRRQGDLHALEPDRARCCGTRTRRCPARRSRSTRW